MKQRFHLKHRKWLSVFVCLLCLVFINKTKLKAQQKKNLPNIVYILADDLGYGDIKIYNAQAKVRTPHIDQLAAQGMRFSDAHTTSSVCTPSRYSILTGRYPWRSRLPIGVLRGYSRTLIEEELPTVASLLKTRSYRTAVIGKWHLGLDWVPKAAFRDSINPAFNKDRMYGIRDEMNPDQIDFSKAPVRGPVTQGFDYAYILPASLDMPPYCYLENDQLTEPLSGYTPGNKLATGYTGPFWRAGLKSPSFDFYDVLPAFTNKATDFIKQQAAAKNPFFLYFPMPAPHTPWMPTAEYSGKSQAGDYGDYIEEVDAAVGKILQALDSLGLSKNTLVVFTSDNGPYWRDDFVQKYKHRAAGPFRGMKGDAFEGGHRVPFIVRYPGKVKAGTVSKVTTTLANLMATCADLTGNHAAQFDAEDSYSILPVLFGQSVEIADQPAIVNISSKGFYDIRKGPWKLITGLGSGGFSAPSTIEPIAGQAAGQLYNLETDGKEETNLYSQYPEKVKELTALLEKIKAAPRGKRAK